MEVYEKDSEEAYSGKRQTTWTLVEVSSYPGCCNNYPARANADQKPDLRFVSEENEDNGLVEIGDARARTAMNTDPHFVAVTSFDYAAYGKLQASVTLEDGTVVEAKFRPSDAPSITIPYDKNFNKIADHWERQMGVSDKPATWDEDPQPALQRRNGDGYTLFEEYRGFKARKHCLRDGSRQQPQDRHFRSDPQYKDLFVYDENGLFEQYYAAENPADLNWHYIQPEEMIFTQQGFDPENRWVNFNKTDYFYAKQYALHLVQRGEARINTVAGHAISETYLNNFPDEGAAESLVSAYIRQTEQNGQPATGVSCHQDAFAQPLRCIYIVEIYQGTIERLCGNLRADRRQAVYQKMLQSTILHEVGHGIGICHHRHNNQEDETEASRGVLDCAMRYTSEAENARPGRLYRWQNRYCKGNETYEVIIEQVSENDPLRILRETHPAHNCYGKIDVKTDPF